MKKQLFNITVLFLLFWNSSFTQNKFYLELDLLGRNSEYYKYLKYSAFSPKISDYEDISLFSFDISGTPNYSIYLKYKQNTYITWTLGYERFLFTTRLPLRYHLFCETCTSETGYYSNEHAHNLPIHLELNIPLCKCKRRMSLNPFIGLNIIYNNISLTNGLLEGAYEYGSFGTVVVHNDIKAEFKPLRQWNLGLRYGVNMEYRIYKDIRINLTFLAQHGLFEIQRTNFEITHLDLLFHHNVFDTGSWVNKQTLLSKRIGIIFPMDWVGDIPLKKYYKEIFKK